MKQLILLFAIISAIIITPNTASAQSVSDILSKLGTVANNVLGSGKVTIADLEGNWTYVEPAVEFKSDNLLKKAGGSVASTTIVDKLRPYYSTVGLDNMTLAVDSAATFKMALKKISFSGEIVRGENDGEFVFKFKAIGKISAGSLNAYISKTATGQIKVTFDVSKLISLVNTIASVTGNSSMKSVSSILNSYDGLTAGFVLKKIK
ncbi:MAG: DUF4923 family protein [Muribaculaceae bacterium]|nr:DUF4923 family protein [Muribaculaceae bacterium]MDE6344176.1 DUF4923 family protein [Muribaculaceae bacterium]MDE6610773.1 DUF4923 family protein [Muribaculaceae bacterium]